MAPPLRAGPASPAQLPLSPALRSGRSLGDGGSDAVTRLLVGWSGACLRPPRRWGQPPGAVLIDTGGGRAHGAFWPIAAREAPRPACASIGCFPRLSVLRRARGESSHFPLAALARRAGRTPRGSHWALRRSRCPPPLAEPRAGRGEPRRHWRKPGGVYACSRPALPSNKSRPPIGWRVDSAALLLEET